jgi:hypothetical protein
MEPFTRAVKRPASPTDIRNDSVKGAALLAGLGGTRHRRNRDPQAGHVHSTIIAKTGPFSVAVHSVDQPDTLVCLAETARLKSGPPILAPAILQSWLPPVRYTLRRDGWHGSSPKSHKIISYDAFDESATF